MAVDAVCMGAILMELACSEQELPLDRAQVFVRAPGGGPANVAVALSRLGLRAGFVGAVGDDPFGACLRRWLEENNVDVSGLFTVSGARTTAVFTTGRSPSGPELCYFRHPGADMMLEPSQVTGKLLSGARCLHFGSLALAGRPCAEAQRKALGLARGQGLMISFDPDYRASAWPDQRSARKAIRDVLPFCHLVKASEEEWETVAGTPDLERGVAGLLEAGVQLVILSRGARGAYAASASYAVEIPAFEAEEGEGGGAGDAFTAAMIARLLSEWDRKHSLGTVPKEVVEEAVLLANAVGALAVTRPARTSALPTRTEAEQFLRKARPRA